MAAYSDGRDERHNREVIAQVGTMLSTIFAQVASDALDSIQNGSAVTGSPGQPVDTGALKASWQLVLEKDHATIGTNLVYAIPIEDGTGKYGPLHLRSEVGGWHSVKLTANNLDRIVTDVTARVRGAA